MRAWCARLVMTWLVALTVLALPAAESAAAQALAAQLAAAKESVVAQRRAIDEARQRAHADLEAQRRELEALRGQLATANAAIAAANEELAASAGQRQHSERRWREQLIWAQRNGLLDHVDADTKDTTAIVSRIGVGLDARMADLVQATTFGKDVLTVFDRRGLEVELPVWRWGQAQIIALGEGPDQRGLLTRDDAGNWLIAGPVPGALPAHQGWIDVSGRLASHPLPVGGLSAFVQRGGPFVWPIFAIAVVALWTIGRRLWWRLRWRRPAGAAQRLLAVNDRTQALAEARAWRGPIAHLLGGILAAPRDQAEGMAGALLAETEVQLARGLRLLAVLAAAAPLVGLLGTVTGMIKSFEALGAAAGAEALSVGISQALLTTELGLLVAVPLLIVHALFARDAARWRLACEAQALRLLGALDGDQHQGAP